MTAPKTAVLLVGSAKPAGESTSEALGTYLLERLATHGLTTSTFHVARVLRTQARMAEFSHAVADSNLFILAFPLYVDTLPYLVTQALEQIAADRQTRPPLTPASFVALANCGFPEAHHNATALAICEQFAAVARLNWAGGLALGAGGAVSGQSLEEAGGMLHTVRAALDRTGDALAQGNPVPTEAIADMARPFIPTTAYMLMGDLGWLLQARQNHQLTHIGARPMQQAKPE